MNASEFFKDALENPDKYIDSLELDEDVKIAIGEYSNSVADVASKSSVAKVLIMHIVLGYLLKIELDKNRLNTLL